MEKVGDTRGSPVSFLREMTRQSVVLASIILIHFIPSGTMQKPCISTLWPCVMEHSYWLRTD